MYVRNAFGTAVDERVGTTPRPGTLRPTRRRRDRAGRDMIVGMDSRAALHELVDRLPEDLIACAAAELVSLEGKKARSDALTRLLDAAPYDDEPYPEHHRRRDDEAVQRLKDGKGLTFTNEQVSWLLENLLAASAK